MSRKCIAFVCALTCLLSGCVRYTSSRKELNRPFQYDPAAEYVGLDEFYRYEREQRRRLELLIAERVTEDREQKDKTYKVGPGDEIQIQVAKFEEITKTYKVRPTGDILLPYVGAVNVRGLTEDEVASYLSELLVDYLTDPIVEAGVTEYAAHKVYVMGAGVGAVSGAYPLKREGYSLVELVVEIGDVKAFSGGVLYFYPAGLSPDTESTEAPRTFFNYTETSTGIKLEDWINIDNEYQECEMNGTRLDDSSAHACEMTRDRPITKTFLDRKYDPQARIQIDFEELFGGINRKPLYVPLRPGDAIYFPPSPIIQVFGEVFERGTFPVAYEQSGQNCQNGIKPTLLSAIVGAKGLTYSADIHDIEIFREIHYGRKVIVTVDLEEVVLRNGQDVRLRDGDIIWVPSQASRFIRDKVINSINAVAGTGGAITQIIEDLDGNNDSN